MSKAGLDPARIADRLHTNIESVQAAVDSFEAMRHSLSADIVETVVNAEVITAISGAGNRIQQAQNAVRFTGAYDQDGAPIMEPDHPLALEAIKTAGELVGRVRERASGGVSVAVGINNQPGGGNGSGQVKTFEQRVREKRGLLPDDDVKLLSDGQGNEVVDGSADDDDDELADELSDGTSDAEIEEAYESV